MNNDPRQLCIQLQSTVDYLKNLACEADVHGHLWKANQMVGGGSCSSEVARAAIRDFLNRPSGEKNNSTKIIQRILRQANEALARVSQTLIQPVAANGNGYDLARVLRERAMLLEVSIFEIRANLP